MEKITIYTDGACSGNPGPGGWGCILIYNNTKKELSGGNKNTTNNIMEITATIEALKADVYKRQALLVLILNQLRFEVNALQKNVLIHEE